MGSYKKIGLSREVGLIDTPPLHCKSFSHFFNKKYWHIWDINIRNFDVSFTNNIVSFEQLDPVNHSKDTDGIANSVDPDQTVPLGAV